MLSAAAAISAWSGAAQAAGTTAGTSIANTASVTYTVGGSTQTAQSNTATFLVDRKVNLTVTEVGGTATSTAIGATDQVTTFQVTNLTNAVQDFILTPDQQSVSLPMLGTDNFDVTNMRVFVDSNGNGTYDAGVDTATFIDELAADASVTVFIVANIPNTAGADVAIVSLVAQAAAGGQSGTQGAALVATSLLTADSPTTVDIVFADSAGSLNDPARDGKGRAFDSYKIATAAISMTKTATVVSDPLNLGVNPKAIPGAVIEYCLTVTNAGPGTGTGVILADAVPAGTTYISNSLNVGAPGIAGACTLAGSTEDDDTSGADESDPYGGSFDGTTVRANISSLGVNAPVAAAFRVTVN
ncbi:DUF11 domain-containing protein [Sphingobium phenoxybenzoativorans]|uniref:DUF11 domain-containing protein n=2 Tax=Sphingobium phenoxybenzoativorans TaxID=1592790 RepID=A0A975Q466_9SPHN|nr:DUF11 domain-containing protein [Sphingobium phenoxybenzoativorans]